MPPYWENTGCPIGNLQNASVKYGIKPEADIALGGGHIFAAHLKETRPGIYRNLFFGEGHTDYISCIRALWRQGVRLYTGEFWAQHQMAEEQSPRKAACFLRQKIEKAAYLELTEAEQEEQHAVFSGD